jgi:competence ComEA-like helix-hairpin-helix protein
VLALGIAGLSRRPRASLQVQRLPALPQDSLIQVYLNHNPAATFTETYRKIVRPGDDLEQVLIDGIQASRFSLEIAVQELRLPRLAAAIAERHRAGVRVRVILENQYSRPWSRLSAQELSQLSPREQERYQAFQRLLDRNRDGQITPTEAHQGDALLILENAGVPWLDDTADGSAGSGLMHHKFIVVDGQRLLLSSANLTLSDTQGDLQLPQSRGNRNALVQITSPQLAALFVEEFNLLWGDGPGNKLDSRFGLQKPFRSAQPVQVGTTTVEVQFSPTSRTIGWQQSTNGLIGRTLSGATASVNMALFVFSDQNLANILEAKQVPGLPLRALVDKGFIHRPYSEALDLLGVALPQEQSTCQFEAGNRPWQRPIETVGFPRLPQGDLLHHKFGVVDRRTVIFGSHNWSEAANHNNDEALIVIHNPTVAAHFEREFESLYDQSVLGISPLLQRKLEGQSCALRSPSPSSVESVSTAPRINLNTASQTELESLPGVGPKLAQRIIQARQQRSFTSLADLEQVPGVGPKVLEQLRDAQAGL